MEYKGLNSGVNQNRRLGGKDYPGGAFEFVEIVESEMVWNLYISFPRLSASTP